MPDPLARPRMRPPFSVSILLLLLVGVLAPHLGAAQGVDPARLPASLAALPEVTAYHVDDGGHLTYLDGRLSGPRDDPAGLIAAEFVTNRNEFYPKAEETSFHQEWTVASASGTAVGLRQYVGGFPRSDGVVVCVVDGDGVLRRVEGMVLHKGDTAPPADPIINADAAGEVAAAALFPGNSWEGVKHNLERSAISPVLTPEGFVPAWRVELVRAEGEKSIRHTYYVDAVSSHRIGGNETDVTDLRDALHRSDAATSSAAPTHRAAQIEVNAQPHGASPTGATRGTASTQEAAPGATGLDCERAVYPPADFNSSVVTPRAEGAAPGSWTPSGFLTFSRQPPSVYSKNGSYTDAWLHLDPWPTNVGYFRYLSGSVLGQEPTLTLGGVDVRSPISQESVYHRVRLTFTKASTPMQIDLLWGTTLMDTFTIPEFSGITPDPNAETVKVVTFYLDDNASWNTLSGAENRTLALQFVPLQVCDPPWGYSCTTVGGNGELARVDLYPGPIFHLSEASLQTTNGVSACYLAGQNYWVEQRVWNSGCELPGTPWPRVSGCEGVIVEGSDCWNQLLAREAEINGEITDGRNTRYTLTLHPDDDPGAPPVTTTCSGGFQVHPFRTADEWLYACSMQMPSVDEAMPGGTMLVHASLDGVLQRTDEQGDLVDTDETVHAEVELRRSCPIKLRLNTVDAEQWSNTTGMHERIDWLRAVQGFTFDLDVPIYIAQGEVDGPVEATLQARIRAPNEEEGNQPFDALIGGAATATWSGTDSLEFTNLSLDPEKLPADAAVGVVDLRIVLAGTYDEGGDWMVTNWAPVSSSAPGDPGPLMYGADLVGAGAQSPIVENGEFALDGWVPSFRPTNCTETYPPPNPPGPPAAEARFQLASPWVRGVLVRYRRAEVGTAGSTCGGSLAAGLSADAPVGSDGCPSQSKQDLVVNGQWHLLFWRGNVGGLILDQNAPQLYVADGTSATSELTLAVDSRISSSIGCVGTDIDTLMVFAPPPTWDLEPVALLYKDGSGVLQPMPPRVDPGTTWALGVRVKNVGSGAVTLGGGTQIGLDIPDFGPAQVSGPEAGVPLSTNESVDIDVSASWVPTTAGLYTFTASVIKGGDADTTNDSRPFQVLVGNCEGSLSLPVDVNRGGE